MWLEMEKINIEISGENNTGPTVLLVHGAGSEAGIWKPFAEKLGAHVRAAAIDLPGHGRSPRRDTPATLDTFVDDIRAAALALGTPVILCGHSMGGALTMLTALKYPEILDKIILLQTGARLRVVPALIEQFKSNFSGAIQSMSGMMFGPGAPPALAAAFAELMSRADPEAALNDFLLCDGFDIMDRLGDIRPPALIVGAENDLATPAKYAAFLHERMPGSQLRMIPGCGHLSMLEKPDDLTGIILDFINS